MYERLTHAGIAITAQATVTNDQGPDSQTMY